jgi:PleD family two-component response regulator
VCSACAEPVRGILTPDERRLTERHGIEPAVRAVGCSECGFTGYRGRLPVAEVLIAGPRFQQAVEERKGWSALTRLAVQGGMRPMHDVALDWVKQAKTTLVEVERVLGQTVEDEAEYQPTGPARILLVDDDREAVDAARAILEKADYEVVEAHTGEDALDILKADPNYSLCILDLLLPGLKGVEVLRQIRDSVDTAALPVMIRTGTGNDRTEAELLESGADEYVAKSVDAARFAARVKAVLRRTLV